MMMSEKKACAMDSVEYGCDRGMKWQYLLNPVHNGEDHRLAAHLGHILEEVDPNVQAHYLWHRQGQE